MFKYLFLSACVELFILASAPPLPASLKTHRHSSHNSTPMAPAVAVPMLPALSLLDPLGALLVGCGVLESAFIGTALAFVVHYREHGLLRATSVDLTLLTVLATGSVVQSILYFQTKSSDVYYTYSTRTLL